jgi:catechol-2,3-dioxygenase
VDSRNFDTHAIDDALGGFDRRRLLVGAAGALIAALHGRGGRVAAAGAGPAPPDGRQPAARIAELELVSAAPLPAMRAFYEGALGLPVMEQPGELTVTAGASRLTFRPAGPDHGGAFYHFAFNIPENKILAARAWQRERTPLIPPGPTLRDPRFPDDVVHFRHWDAHSVFFWDPAGNLLEHIARHTLGNAAGGPFTSADLLCVSEIGLIVEDVAAAAATLREAFALADYRGTSDQFNAVGDEHGLLLVMKRGRNLGFGEGKPGAIFPTAATIRAPRPAELALPGYPYRVRAA